MVGQGSNRVGAAGAGNASDVVRSEKTRKKRKRQREKEEKCNRDARLFVSPNSSLSAAPSVSQTSSPCVIRMVAEGALKHEAAESIDPARENDAMQEGSESDEAVDSVEELFDSEWEEESSEIGFDTSPKRPKRKWEVQVKSRRNIRARPVFHSTKRSIQNNIRSPPSPIQSESKQTCTEAREVSPTVICLDDEGFKQSEESLHQKSALSGNKKIKIAHCDDDRTCIGSLPPRQMASYEFIRLISLETQRENGQYDGEGLGLRAIKGCGARNAVVHAQSNPDGSRHVQILDGKLAPLPAAFWVAFQHLKKGDSVLPKGMRSKGSNSSELDAKPESKAQLAAAPDEAVFGTTESAEQGCQVLVNKSVIKDEGAEDSNAFNKGTSIDMKSVRAASANIHLDSKGLPCVALSYSPPSSSSSPFSPSPSSVKVPPCPSSPSDKSCAQVLSDRAHGQDNTHRVSSEDGLSASGTTWNNSKIVGGASLFSSQSQDESIPAQKGKDLDPGTQFVPAATSINITDQPSESGDDEDRAVTRNAQKKAQRGAGLPQSTTVTTLLEISNVAYSVDGQTEVNARDLTNDPYALSRWPPIFDNRVFAYREPKRSCSVIGEKIVYWAQVGGQEGLGANSVRVHDNWALLHALWLQRELELPVVALCFLPKRIAQAIDQEMGKSNARMCPSQSEGFRSTPLSDQVLVFHASTFLEMQAELKKYGIPLVGLYADRKDIVSVLATFTRKCKVHAVVTPESYHPRGMQLLQAVGRALVCPFFAVDSANIFPPRKLRVTGREADQKTMDYEDFINYVEQKSDKRALEVDWHAFFESHIQQNVTDKGLRGKTAQAALSELLSRESSDDVSIAHKLLPRAIFQRWAVIHSQNLIDWEVRCNMKEGAGPASRVTVRESKALVILEDFRKLILEQQQRERQQPPHVGDNERDDDNSLDETEMSDMSDSFNDLQTKVLTLIRVGVLSPITAFKRAGLKGSCFRSALLEREYLEHRAYSIFVECCKSGGVASNKFLVPPNRMAARQCPAIPGRLPCPGDLIKARSDDATWNILQTRLLKTGVMAGAGNVGYWVQKVVEWSLHEQDGLELALSWLENYMHGGQSAEIFAKVYISQYEGDASFC